MPRIKKDGTEAKKTGPKIRYTPEELMAKAEAFLSKCEEEGKCPFPFDFINYIGIKSERTAKRWCEEGPDAEKYAEAFDYVSLRCQSFLAHRSITEPKVAQGCLNALKQPQMGGWIDRPVDSGESKVTINLVGCGGANAAK